MIDFIDPTKWYDMIMYYMRNAWSMFLSCFETFSVNNIFFLSFASINFCSDSILLSLAPQRIKQASTRKAAQGC